MILISDCLIDLLGLKFNGSFFHFPDAEHITEKAKVVFINLIVAVTGKSKNRPVEQKKIWEGRRHSADMLKKNVNNINVKRYVTKTLDY